MEDVVRTHWQTNARVTHTRLGTRVRFAVGVLFGLATQLLFLLTVCHLFAFLKGPIPARSGSLWWDVLLASQFALPHSWLLLPSTRKRLSRWIAAPFYGLVFCLATCASLFVTFSLWQTSDVRLWDVAPQGRWLIDVGYYGSWIALFYSLHLSGLGYQTGLTPWWYWVRGMSQPRRGFELRGAYRVMRHPIYASFLGLIWFTPTMTLDHAILTGLWTAYIFVGSSLKDARLAHYLGDSYRQYEARIPGFGISIRRAGGRQPPDGVRLRFVRGLTASGSPGNAHQPTTQI